MRLSKRATLTVVVVGMLALVVSACDTFSGGTEVGDLETRSAQLQGTIEAMGTPAQTIVALQMTADEGMRLQAELSNARGTVIALQDASAGSQAGGGALQSTPAAPDGSPALAPGEAATPPPGGVTTFTQTTTATGVRDSDGCASNSTAIFDTTEDQIYVVTTINNLQAGSVFSARWLANGALFYEDATCWIPQQDWSTVCAWCSITPDQETFEPGNWTVELLLDGQLLAQAQFQVADSSQPAGSDGTGDMTATPPPA